MSALPLGLADVILSLQTEKIAFRKLRIMHHNDSAWRNYVIGSLQVAPGPDMADRSGLPP